MNYRIIRKNELYHHGIKGQKWGVRNGPPYPLTEVRKIPDIPIHKSVGAKYNIEKVYDPISGQYFDFVPGTKIQDAEIFAGKGTKSPIYNESLLKDLCDDYGGKASDWQRGKGKGHLDYYGEDRPAEIHWSQADGIGKHEFKVKRWLD